MHRALLIDEIVREIFQYFCDDEKEYTRQTLTQVARCCHAWKVPALEKIWRRLPCIDPFIKFFQHSGYSDSECIYEYGRKVRLIQLCTNSRDLVALDKLLGARNNNCAHLFPNLESVKIARHGCTSPAIRLLLTPALCSVDIDIGEHTGRRKVGVERSGNVASYLCLAATASYPLGTVRIRGFACGRLNASVGSLRMVRVLVLKVGSSLVTDTLVAIASFPMLEELKVHADRVDPAEFKAKAMATSAAFTLTDTTIMTTDKPFFPSLRRLKIRSQLALTTIILQHIQSPAFIDLDMEIIDAQDSSKWVQLFSVIHAHPNIPDSLRRLKIEHHIEIEELEEDTLRRSVQRWNNEDDDDNSDDYDDNDDGAKTTTDTRFSINTLRHLSKLSNLQGLIIDANPPPNLDDKDVDEISRWWPHLECLDFSYFPLFHYDKGRRNQDDDDNDNNHDNDDKEGEDGDNEDEDDDFTWSSGRKPRTTLACLTSLASRCPKLKRLVLPVDVTHSSAPPNTSDSLPYSQYTLRQLVIWPSSRSSTITSGPTRSYIHSLFPSLEPTINSNSS